MKRRFSIGLTICGLVFGVACEDREQQAAIAAAGSRELEQAVESLQASIDSYKEVANTYPGTPSGTNAQSRSEQLEAAQSLIITLQAAGSDSILRVAGDVLEVAPNYLPALAPISRHLLKESEFWGRFASQRKDNSVADRVLKLWAQQDSLWSNYPFLATPVDRGWGDVVCVHATDVARMLEGLRRYKEAHAVVTRGLGYGRSRPVLSEAKVFASFYTFRLGNYEGAVTLADEALETEEISTNLKARAHHVKGLGYTYLYQRSERPEDLDSAISSLNEAIGLAPEMKDVRTLLRKLRERKAATPS